MVKFDFKSVKQRRDKLDIKKSEMNIDVDRYEKIENGIIFPSLEEINLICKKLNLDINSIYDKNYRHTYVLNMYCNKGGVGKTSVSIGLTAALAKLGYKVLALDLDSQCNFSCGLGFFNGAPIEKSSFNMLKKTDNARNYIQKTEYENIDIIAANAILSSIEIHFHSVHKREEVLKKCLKDVIESGTYDFIVIDGSPSSSMLNINSILISDYIISPVLLTEYGMQGIDHSLDIVNSLMSEDLGAKVERMMFVVNALDRRDAHYKDYYRLLNKIFNGMILKSMIRTDINVKNSQKVTLSISDSLNSNAKDEKEFDFDFDFDFDKLDKTSIPYLNEEEEEDDEDIKLEVIENAVPYIYSYPDTNASKDMLNLAKEIVYLTTVDFN